MDDYRDKFVKLFGDDAPAVPKNREELMKLPTLMLCAIEASLPAFYQSVAGDVDKLPAAVSLRRDKGLLTMEDLRDLRRAGMVADAAEVELKYKEHCIQDLQDRVAKKGQYAPDPAVNEAKEREAHARAMSRSGYVGRID